MERTSGVTAQRAAATLPIEATVVRTRDTIGLVSELSFWTFLEVGRGYASQTRRHVVD